MKVFISWSGEVSKEIGALFNKWLRDVFHNITPVYTPVDIKAGEKGIERLLEMLEDVQVALLIYTPESLDSSWMTFEAGTVLNTMKETTFIPILFDIHYRELPAPIKERQWKTFNKSGIWQVIESLHYYVKTNDQYKTERVRPAFERTWVAFERSVLKKQSELQFLPKTPEERLRQLRFDKEDLETKLREEREQNAIAKQREQHYIQDVKKINVRLRTVIDNKQHLERRNEGLEQRLEEYKEQVAPPYQGCIALPSVSVLTLLLSACIVYFGLVVFFNRLIVHLCVIMVFTALFLLYVLVIKKIINDKKRKEVVPITRRNLNVTINKLTLATADAERLEDFYGEVLKVPTRKTSYGFCATVGTSQIHWVEKEEATPYYFAINIPSNKMKEALKWLEDRVLVLDYKGKQLLKSTDWDGDILCFYDTDKNLVKLIAHDQQPHFLSSFSEGQFLCVSEITAPVEDLLESGLVLEKDLSLPFLRSDKKSYSIIGGENGALVLAHQETRIGAPFHHKLWPSTFQIEMQDGGRSVQFSYSDKRFIILDVEEEQDATS